MKKRIFALALAVAMLLGLAACGEKEYDNLILSLDESSQNEQGGSNAESWRTRPLPQHRLTHLRG